jgi:hypothetical protein
LIILIKEGIQKKRKWKDIMRDTFVNHLFGWISTEWKNIFRTNSKEKGDRRN